MKLKTWYSSNIAGEAIANSIFFKCQTQNSYDTIRQHNIIRCIPGRTCHVLKLHMTYDKVLPCYLTAILQISMFEILFTRIKVKKLWNKKTQKAYISPDAFTSRTALAINALPFCLLYPFCQLFWKLQTRWVTYKQEFHLYMYTLNISSILTNINSLIQKSLLQCKL